MAPYPRDLIGYGRTPPRPHWPGGARLALQFVINYEEGGESNILHGDPASESLLSDIVGAVPMNGVRHVNIESDYEFGSRVGFWRLHRLFTERALPVTVFAVAMALERNPAAAAAMVEAGWEIASHGYRWLDYHRIDVETERVHLRRAVEGLSRLTGARPLGHYQGRCSPQTRRLVMEEGGFLYDSDSYGDDLPFWVAAVARPHLVIPYTLELNDIRFVDAPGFATGVDFFGHLKNAFDLLYREGEAAAKMMSVGLHGRLVGRPGRAQGLARFLDYARSHDKVWICRRVDIAQHWHTHHAIG